MAKLIYLGPRCGDFEHVAAPAGCHNLLIIYDVRKREGESLHYFKASRTDLMPGSEDQDYRVRPYNLQ